MKQKWEQGGGKPGTRAPKRDKNGNKVEIQREQECQSGTRMGTNLEEQNGIKMKFRIPKWRKNGNKKEIN